MASVAPTLFHSAVTALEAVAPVIAVGAAGPVIVVAAVISVAPIVSLTVVAALNVDVVKNVSECRIAPAGTTKAVPVKLALMEAKPRVTV
jgi:hypothetical protein